MLKNSVLFLLSLAVLVSAANADDAKKIKALMLVGGCCHDYKKMPGELTGKISELASVSFDIKFLATAQEQAALLRDTKYAEGYDVIVYDLCFGEAWEDGDYDGALKVHKQGKPAVFIHCSMHNLRPPRNLKDPRLKEREAICDAKWHALVGMDSRVHDKKQGFSTVKVAKDHPILKSFPDDWKTAADELYNTIKVMPTATPLLQSTSPSSQKVHTVAWINRYADARVFGTTLGHDMVTGADPAYQKLLAYGLLWACDKLTEDGTPQPGYGGSK